MMNVDDLLKMIIAASTLLAIVGTMLMIHGNKKAAPNDSRAP